MANNFMKQTAYTDTSNRNADQNRNAERTILGRPGVLRIGNCQQPIEVLVRDLTRDGCGVQGDTPVEPGMNVEIGIANLGRISATVLWCGVDSFGCIFNLPLPPGSVTAALGPRNVVSFPSDAASPVSPAAHKLHPRNRLLVIAGTTSLCWTTIAVIMFAFA